MATIHFQLKTPLAPLSVMAVLTDFSPKRAKTWPNIDAQHFQLHAQGPSWAEVTEGSSILGGVYECEKYTWDPTLLYVTAYTLDSNLWDKSSGWDYQLTPYDGGTLIKVTVIRVGKNVKGRLIALLLSLFGTSTIRSHLASALLRATPRPS